jgi:hypothetical protein
MNQPAILTPPRPLPGLEVYPATRALPPWIVSVPLLVAALASIWWIRRGRISNRRRTVGAIAPTRGAEADPTRDLIDQVRDALVSRFGPGWSSRTTEEIAASTELATILGDDATRMLTAWLAELDQFRFAPNHPPTDRPFAPPGPWLQEIFDRLTKDART